jgi:retron-type reverse transcriptase
MFEFDEAVKEIVTPIGVNYTRYADDLTFSGERIETLESVEREVRRLLANTRSPVIRLNERKRGIYTRGMKRMITGVKVTPKGAISIGRERKRLISSFVFRASIKKLSKDQLIVTQGWLAFANTVEPEFLDRLRKKYGNIVDLLLRQSTK